MSSYREKRETGWNAPKKSRKKESKIKERRSVKGIMKNLKDNYDVDTFTYMSLRDNGLLDDF